jgi:hypothetical protein
MFGGFGLRWGNTATSYITEDTKIWRSKLYILPTIASPLPCRRRRHHHLVVTKGIKVMMLRDLLSHSQSNTDVSIAIILSSTLGKHCNALGYEVSLIYWTVDMSLVGLVTHQFYIYWTSGTLVVVSAS